MELVFVKQGMGWYRWAVTYPAQCGISLFLPLARPRAAAGRGQRMEYENIIFEPEFLGGAEDLCAEKYLLPLQSGRLSAAGAADPYNDLCYLQAAACLRELKMPTAPSAPASELLVKGRCCFLALLIAQARASPPKPPTPSG